MSDPNGAENKSAESIPSEPVPSDAPTKEVDSEETIAASPEEESEAAVEATGMCIFPKFAFTLLKAMIFF